MAKPDDWQLGFSFDAATHAAVVAPIDVPGLPTDAPAPDVPVELSPQTRVSVVDVDEPAPTVTTNESIGDAKQVAIVASGPTAAEKPAYRIPLMTEIAALPPNGLTVVSTFSGCGGSCLGFKMAGYRVAWANEFIPAAQDTYRRNHPSTILSTADIRTVTGAAIRAAIRAAIGDVEIDVLEGSPPCASFSTAGKTSKGWGQVRKYSDTEQRTDDLFEQYIRLVDELRPRAFVAENVSGMVKGVAKGFFLRYLRKMQALPYNVEARLLDAQWLGVPQARVRLIFVGVRQDVGRPSFPKKLPYRYSVRDALPWIVRQGDNGGFGEGAMRETDVPSPTIGSDPSTGNGKFPPSLVEVAIVGDGFKPDVVSSIDDPSVAILASPGGRIQQVETRKVTINEVVGDNVAPSLDGYAVGEELRKLAPGESSDKFFNLVRVDAETPCPTVTAAGGGQGSGAPGGNASIVHPTERRKFTIAELRRICGFPDDFVLTGTYAQSWERLGRAVPPPMMYAVAAMLAEQVFGRAVPSFDNATSVCRAETSK